MVNLSIRPVLAPKSDDVAFGGRTIPATFFRQKHPKALRIRTSSHTPRWAEITRNPPFRTCTSQKGEGREGIWKAPQPSQGRTANTLAQLNFNFSTAVSPARSSGAAPALRFAETPADSPSARNTISLDGRHRRSASVEDCVSIPPTAGSLFLGLAARRFSRTLGRSASAERKDSTPLRS